ncbi:hypothetical protein TQ33_0565 [Kangiella geojedonensis]|uniref:Uncharacterized protein n=2 Tax=Kangiella geojedonensis TaxID=914150 RepID=A0A0F6RBX6_9GAMM|nr:hypothetical protein TQ33_0565 [Kangiella geojedonensis]
MLAAIKSKFFSWIDSRAPKQPSTLLRQRNIYILPTRYGWLMLGILILILIASTNYQNNMGFMAGFVLLAVGLLSVFYTFRNLKGVEVRCLKPVAVFATDIATVPVQLVNNTKSERVGFGVGFSKRSVSYTDVGEQAKSQVELTLETRKRGMMDIPRIACASIFPFGIFEAWSWVRTPYQVLVYPKPIPCPEPLVATSSGIEEGQTQEKGSEDFHNLRDYQAGDPIKQVMWKAYARERGLYSKEFEDYVGEHQTLSWESVAHYEKELAISYLTDAVLTAEVSQNVYGLELPQETIDKGQGPEHLHSCLKALALM